MELPDNATKQINALERLVEEFTSLRKEKKNAKEIYKFCCQIKL